MMFAAPRFVGGKVLVRTVCLIGGCLFGPIGSANAQLIFADSFNYPDGFIVGASGSPWVNNYEPTNEASVVSGRLFLTQSKQESIRVNFPAYKSGYFYARMIVNFSALPVGEGNFFAFIRNATDDTLLCRIWTSTNGAASGRFRLGIADIFDGPVMISKDLFLGTNYMVVCRFEHETGYSTLWINPTDESDVANRADDDFSAGDYDIGQYGFSQTLSSQAGSGNYIGAVTVDDLRLGHSFSEVLPLVKFTSISNATISTLDLRATGQATTNYALQTTTNLLSTNWVDLGTFAAGTNGLIHLIVAKPSNSPNRFFRLLKP